MKRIHLHWTAGGNTANATDRKHYHFIVEGDGNVELGNFTPDENIPPLRRGFYAEHTKSANSNAVGVSLAGMRGAKEVLFNAGDKPINALQFNAACKFIAGLCMDYGISVARDTVLTHAEVEDRLGIKQKNKWDITRLPWDKNLVGATVVGDYMRRLVSDEIEVLTRKSTTNWGAIFEIITTFILKLFKRGE